MYLSKDELMKMAPKEIAEYVRSISDETAEFAEWCGNELADALDEKGIARWAVANFSLDPWPDPSGGRRKGTPKKRPWPVGHRRALGARAGICFVPGGFISRQKGELKMDAKEYKKRFDDIMRKNGVVTVFKEPEEWGRHWNGGDY